MVEVAVVDVPVVLAGDDAAGGGSTARPRLAARARGFFGGCSCLDIVGEAFRKRFRTAIELVGTMVVRPAR
eukprot:scaffold1001_cov169-Amphora_coffeaeformis.AAC.9